MFDNYTAEDCECGTAGPAIVAAGFMLPFGAVASSCRGRSIRTTVRHLGKNSTAVLDRSLFVNERRRAQLGRPLEERNLIHVRVARRLCASWSNLYRAVDFIIGGKRDIFCR